MEEQKDGEGCRWKEGNKCSQWNGHSKGILCLAVDTSESTLASGSEDKTVRLWDLKNGGKAKRCIASFNDSVSEKILQYLILEGK